jgi:hypothetical protein
MKVCASPECSQEIPPPTGRTRPRKYCTSCRPPRGAVVDMPTQPPNPDQPTEHPLIKSYRGQLERVEQLNTPAGAQVMLLAQELTGGAHSASGVAALSRELRALLEVVLARATTHSDALDELAKKRQQKLAGA